MLYLKNYPLEFKDVVEVKPKIAFVVQRYGLEVNGGAELLCRLVAERLVETYDVEVLTTCAIDYMTWKDEYQSGISEINGVKVYRFHSEKRKVDEFNKYSEKLFSNKNHTWNDEIEWVNRQGPKSDDLINYLRENERRYVAIIFFTYLYYTTYYGLQLLPYKSILVPTAHDEPPVYLNAYRPIFQLPRWIMFNTDEERSFVHRHFNNSHIPNKMVGVGVDNASERNPRRFREKFNLHDIRFILYIGRIDESKGCKELFDYMFRYNKEAVNPVNLVLLGKPHMNIPQDPHILPLGFVTDEDKWDALAATELLVMPSQYESLSMVVLESMSIKRSVLVNGKSEVLKGHCVKSNAGLYYENYQEFKACLDFMLEHPEVMIKMGENGEQYVQENYQWDVIIQKYVDAIESVRSNK